MSDSDRIHVCPVCGNLTYGSRPSLRHYTKHCHANEIIGKHRDTKKSDEGPYSTFKFPDDPDWPEYWWQYGPRIIGGDKNYNQNSIIRWTQKYKHAIPKRKG